MNQIKVERVEYIIAGSISLLAFIVSLARRKWPWSILFGILFLIFYHGLHKKIMKRKKK